MISIKEGLLSLFADLKMTKIKIALLQVLQISWKTIVTRSREMSIMSHMSAMIKFEFSIQSTCPFKILHFDPNPITIRILVPEI